MSVESKIIKPIAKGIVHRICSGQVILDLSSAVKELVENSLDAGATSIEISLKDFGEEWFQVIDNGRGISPNNFKVLALKHHTSKLSEFHDLQSLTTFGFRGEALSSLCALGNLTVETRTASEQVATLLTFNHSGALADEKKTARQVGTTVTVKKLFSNLPVRSKEFKRNIRKEYGKLVSLLNAYALIAKGVRFGCTNITGKNAKSAVLKTQGNDSLKDNIITVLGMNTFNCLEPMALCISESCKVDGFLSKPGLGNGRNLGDRQYFFVNGRPVDMPKVGKLVNELYRSANSKQYPIAILNFSVPTKVYDVNVTPDKRKIFFSEETSLLQALREGLQQIYSPDNASYAVNEFMQPGVRENCFESCSSQKKSPIVTKPSSLNGILPCEEHYTECKTDSKDASESDEEDLFSEERLISENIRGSTGQEFILKAHKSLKGDDTRGRQPASAHSAWRNQATRVSRTIDQYSSDSPRHVQSTLNNFVAVSKRKHDDIITALSEVPVLRNQAPHHQLKTANTETNDLITRSYHHLDQINETSKPSETENLQQLTPDSISHKSVNSPSFRDGSTDREPGMKLYQENTTQLADTATITPSSNNLISTTEHVLVSDSPIRSSPLRLDSPKSYGQKIFSNMQFSFQDLKSRREKSLSLMQPRNYRYGKYIGKSHYTAATLELSQPESEQQKESYLAAAATELERFFKKEDFSRMKVIGQFNLGFIIGKLDQDLFIVDQHAADEKYNFECLSQSTILNQQPLLRPINLELSPEEEIVASIHMDIIRKNGFTLEEDLNAPPGCRYKLKSVPYSKNTVFGVEDVKDLISTLSDGDGHGECSIIGSYKQDSTDSICPPRVRAMLASRACRSSIMIGDALGRNEMQKIVEHLAELKSPWNCPHGRPTMRHLVDLTKVHKRSELTMQM
ncbi:unnamed protein product [Lathyrus sativus]|nr:unnamed protein product [Lathyrus sativus]